MQDKSTGEMKPISEREVNAILESRRAQRAQDGRQECVLMVGGRVDFANGAVFSITAIGSRGIRIRARAPEDMERMRESGVARGLRLTVDSGVFQVEAMGDMFIKLRGLPTTTVVEGVLRLSPPSSPSS